MTVTTLNRSRGEVVAASTGVLFAIAVIAGVLLASAPRPNASPADIQQAFLDNAAAVRMQAFVQTAAAVLLLPFTAVLANLVRTGEGRPSGLTAAIVGGGVLAAAFLMVQSLLTATLATEGISDSPALASALRQLVFYTGGVGHVVWLGFLVGAASVAAHGARALPRWLSTAGIVSGVLSVLSLLSLLVEPAALFIPVGRFSAIVVIAIAGVLVAAGKAGAATAKASVGSSVLGGVLVVILAFVLTVTV
ncbi:MAG: hypothetical protein ACRDMV_01850 [Streptosporangiales bacterium]